MKPDTPQELKLNPEEWVNLHGDYLFRFALGRLRNIELAENAVQETLLAAFKNIKHFRRESSERTWLIGILKHKIIDHLRKRSREIPITDLLSDQSDQKVIDNFFDKEDHPKEYPTAWLPNPRELSKKNEFWEIFEMCFKKLPEITAHAFSLKEIDKRDIKEICKVLGISTTNLYVRLHRARLQLRGCLEKNWLEK